MARLISAQVATTSIGLESARKAQYGVRSFVVEPPSDRCRGQLRIDIPLPVANIKHFAHLARISNFEIRFSINAARLRVTSSVRGRRRDYHNIRGYFVVFADNNQISGTQVAHSMNVVDGEDCFPLTPVALPPRTFACWSASSVSVDVVLSFEDKVEGKYAQEGGKGARRRKR